MTRLGFVLMVLLIVLSAGAFAQPAPAGGETTTAPAPAPTLPPTLAAPLRPSPCILSVLRLLQPRMVQTLTSSLSLSDEQKAKILNMLTKAEEDAQPKIEAQRKAGEEFAIALGKSATKEAELSLAGDKAMKAEAEILKDKIKTLYALKALLTEEQNEALAGVLAQYGMTWLPREKWPQPRPTPTPAPPPAPTAPTLPPPPPAPLGDEAK